MGLEEERRERATRGGQIQEEEGVEKEIRERNNKQNCSSVKLLCVISTYLEPKGDDGRLRAGKKKESKSERGSTSKTRNNQTKHARNQKRKSIFTYLPSAEEEGCPLLDHSALSLYLFFIICMLLAYTCLLLFHPFENLIDTQFPPSNPPPRFSLPLSLEDEGKERSLD